MPLRPITAAPALDDLGIGDDLQVGALDIAVIGHDLAAHFAADPGLVSGKSGVLSGIHEELVDVFGGALNVTV